MTAVTIRRDQVTDYRATLADRGKYRSVEAHWQDREQGKQATQRAGEGKPVLTLRHTYPDAKQAKDAARSRLEQLERGRSTVSLTLANGDPKLRSQSRVILTGFRSGIDGDWLATKVIHKLTTSGYTTRLEAETPAD